MRILKESSLRYDIGDLINDVRSNPTLQTKYIVYEGGWDQYAEGVTGITYYNKAYIKEDGSLFDNKEEARAAAVHFKTVSRKKAGKNRGYGPVGGFNIIVTIMTVKKFLQLVRQGDPKYDYTVPSTQTVIEKFYEYQ